MVAGLAVGADDDAPAEIFAEFAPPHLERPARDELVIIEVRMQAKRFEHAQGFMEQGQNSNAKTQRNYLLSVFASLRLCVTSIDRIMLVLGIMSGTSIDSVDYALCDVQRERIRLREYWQVKFPNTLRRRLHAAAAGQGN